MAGSSPEKLGITEEDYCRKVNRYAQLVYLGVRPEHIPIRRVRKTIIPLLEKAYQKITLKGKPFDYFKRITKLRRDELNIMYYTGHGPAMPNDVLQKFLTGS